MRFELHSSSTDFFKVCRINSRVKKYLHRSIQSSKRYYEDGFWYVHTSEVVNLTRMGYAEFGHVDYRVLPDSLQMQIAAEKHQWRKGSTYTPHQNSLGKSEALKIMYLQEGAPAFIIEAVWRALAKKHHPDRGGSNEEFTAYLKAYNVIKG